MQLESFMQHRCAILKRAHAHGPNRLKNDVLQLLSRYPDYCMKRHVTCIRLPLVMHAVTHNQDHHIYHELRAPCCLSAVKPMIDIMLVCPYIEERT